MKLEEEELNPSYSRLRILRNAISESDIYEIIQEYCDGIKEILFVSDRDNYLRIIDCLGTALQNKKLVASGSNLMIGEQANTHNVYNDEYSIKINFL